MEHVELIVYKRYIPCPLEEPPGKALGETSTEFLDVILGNTHGVSSKIIFLKGMFWNQILSSDKQIRIRLIW